MGKEEHAVGTRGGEAVGAGNQGFRDYGTETGDAQVGGGTCAEAGDARTETVDTEVGRGTC